ncbi:MAG: hypothetical protein Ta2B_29020 [Termitinemataceae bacterium]|nr:MAG: hypothetical protein Ta2B_29020 [Termitinemataceae bacterium]
MDFPILSCGIFQLELEHILPNLREKLGEEILLKFLPPGLDVSEAKLEAAIAEGLASFNNRKTALLYGSMCHTNMAELAKTSNSIYPKPANCAAMLLGAEKKKAMDAQGNFYYLTLGGLRLWREIYKEGHGWDDADARVNFASFEKIIVLDTGVIEIPDEELFEFFEYTQVPVEIEKISLDHFETVVFDMCKKLL